MENDCQLFLLFSFFLFSFGFLLFSLKMKERIIQVPQFNKLFKLFWKRVPQKVVIQQPKKKKEKKMRKRKKKKKIFLRFKKKMKGNYSFFRLKSFPISEGIVPSREFESNLL